MTTRPKMSPVSENQINLLRELGLKEYHAKALAHLLELGESKAPELSSASGVPKARIYGVLDELGDRGLIEVKPGRPTKYIPKSPEEIVERTVQNKKAEKEREIEKVKSLEEDLKTEFKPLYESSVEKSRKPLLKTVSVGDPSERETKLIYQEAEEEINIITRSMEWLPTVEEPLLAAADRGVEIKIIFLEPERLEDEDRPVQEESIKTLREDLPEVEMKYSNFRLPLRGSIIDPSYDYTTGKAIFLVEERGVPLKLRDAAITENPSLVAGMKRYFDLIWEYDSSEIESEKNG